MKGQAYNPFLPLWEYIPDGEPHVFGDRVYVYGSHDKEKGETFCMLDYMGWSAPVEDLSDWQCSGAIYSAKQDPRYDPQIMQYMFAPDVVQGNDGRFYLYYCLSGPAGVGGYSNPVSVAVCDTPDGKYEYLGVVRNPDGSPMWRYVCFDPAVTNDGGKVRLYYGTTAPWLDTIPSRDERDAAYAKTFGRTLEQYRSVPEGISGAYCVTLADDMLTVVDGPRRIDDSIAGSGYAQHAFFEASSMRKIGDTYYFIYSSVKNHELCYATSKRYDRDFVYGGTIVSNGDVGFRGRADKDRVNHTGTNHGSIECINGQWYVFYHRLTHLSDYSRQACAEKITVLPDGSIPQVEITSCGLNAGPLKGEGTYPAAICCNLTNGAMHHGSNSSETYDAPAVASGKGERFVGNIGSGTRIGYKYFALDGEKTLTLSLRGSFRGSVQVLTEYDGEPVAVIPVEPSQTWKRFQAKLPPLHGTYPIFLRFAGEGKADLLELSFE